ncbi:unnamed protein product [Sphagnum balticum]
MELNLRKARKLEAKIAAYLTKDEVKSTATVRIQAGKVERETALLEARTRLTEQVNTRQALTRARFSIRKAIADANHAVGIDSLMNEREEVTTQLALSTAALTPLDSAAAEDLIQAKRARLEKGDSNRYGDDGVTVDFSVADARDIATWKANDVAAKRRLEDLEDQLSQKNLGAKITLPSETAKLLGSVGLL